MWLPVPPARSKVSLYLMGAHWGSRWTVPPTVDEREATQVSPLAALKGVPAVIEAETLPSAP